MPCKAEGLVLTVDPNVIHKVDTGNAQNLFSMWTVFSRCADSVEQGRRLENLSWRLWNRETFCCDPAATKQAQFTSMPTSLPRDIPAARVPEPMPQLSASVDSIAEDEEAIEFSSDSDPVEILRPKIQRQDSCASSRSRGRERHLTSGDLEKMVVNIIQEKEPNLAPLTDMEISSPSLEPESDDSQPPSSPAETQDTIETPTTPATEPMFNSAELPSDASPSQTVSSQMSSSVTSQGRTKVVRGFSPSNVSIPMLRLQSQESMRQSIPSVIPEPNAAPAPRQVQSKRQPHFILGHSSGDESSPQSLEVRQGVSSNAKMLGPHGSSASGEESSPLKSALHSARPASLLNVQKKQASFSNKVSMRTIQSSSEQSDSYMDESAIDDDEDDSDWEDSIEESGKSSMDDAVTFKRGPSKTNLPSHRSLISLMFAGHGQRSKGSSNLASQSTSALHQRARATQSSSTLVASPNDSDDHGLEMKKGARQTLLKPISEAPRSSARPIMVNAHAQGQQVALSPRTTRRNMLATELTESLRRQLLWERQQKTSTANAVLKRRHTSHDVANLKQFPEKAYMNKGAEEPPASSWNQYLNRESLGGYHAQGW